MVEKHRQTKETDILVRLDMHDSQPSKIATGLPFFNHLLNAMSFHGNFHLEIQASGDLDVDPHHLVEDTGLVIGVLLEQIRREAEAISRYGQASIPMDDALGKVCIDLGGRPYLVWRVDWPQNYAGNFDLTLLKEFFWALSMTGKLNLHMEVPYADNGHHAAEALFKALGRALADAYSPTEQAKKVMSTKGIL